MVDLIALCDTLYSTRQPDVPLLPPKRLNFAQVQPKYNSSLKPTSRSTLGFLDGNFYTSLEREE